MAFSALAKHGEGVDDAWIVVLDDPPMVRFDGDSAVQSAIGGKLRATAPAATGAARLDVTTPAAQAYSNYLSERRAAVLTRLDAVLGRRVEPVHVYEIVENGFSVRLSAVEAAALRGMAGVRDVVPVEIHHPLLDAGPGRIGADSLWQGQVNNTAYRGEGQVIGVIDTGIAWDHAYFSDQVSGYTYTNPLGAQLGECSRAQVHCNNKLIGVYDFTDEDTTGRDINGHGSHVASIAAGNPVDFGQTPTSGVAPRAHIVSYKVCVEDEDGGRARCQSDAIIAALEQAVADGVDVVNYSIGGSANNPWTSTSAGLFLNLREAGIVPVTSAGNSGPAAASITSPANAPWVLAVGNSHHGRVSGNRVDAAGVENLLGILGSGPAPGTDISASLIDAAAVGDALGCSAFPVNGFAGAVALISRGGCFFRDKVDHAHAAGAVAVIVYNNDPEPPFRMDMQGGTSIPAAMISLADGLEVRSAMAQATQPRATLQARTRAMIDRNRIDRMAASSSRGPNPFAEGVMKPNLAAPGSSILGAGIASANASATLTGTSMASPHVAGAAALLLQANPGWTPSMVISALETTAQHSDMRDFDGVLPDVTARGAGRVQVDAAARAGLYLDVSPTAFRSAQSNPGALNLAGIVGEACAGGCEFSRRLTALRGGSWRVETSGEIEIEVSPGQFTLTQGQSVTLQILVTAPEPIAGAWASGSVDLVPASGQLATQSLPVGIAAQELLEITAGANRGRTQVHVAGTGPVSEAAVASTALVKADVATRNLPTDPDPSDPYDGSAGTAVIWLDVPEDAALLYAQTLASTAVDVDLFVGFDAGNTGRPREPDERCAATSPDDLERCLIARPDAGRWWVLIQNWQGSGGASDAVSVRTAVVPQALDASLAATGAGALDAGLMPLRMAWDAPALRRDEAWLGVVSVHDAANPAGGTRLIPVAVRRDSNPVPEHTALLPFERTPVVVPAGGVHDRLFVDSRGRDWPAVYQVQLQVSVTGAGVDAALAFMEFDETAASEPLTPPAPAQRLDNVTRSVNGDTQILTVSDADLKIGRYYVILENAAGNEALVELEAAFSPVTIFDPPLPQMQPAVGLWSPRYRGTHQGIAWDQAGWGFITWYTYDEDGTPVFYLAAGPIDPLLPFWTADLDRYTATREDRQHFERVGRVMLTTLAENDVIFSWQVNGAHGSERMAPLASDRCRDGQSLTGLWVTPGKTIGGTTTVVNPATRGYIRYFYDALGLPRWMISGDELGGNVLQALEPFGWCPYCQPTGSGLIEAGTYEIDFSDEDNAREIIDARLQNGFELFLDAQIEKISDRKECE